LDNTLVDRDGAVRRLLSRWAAAASLEPELLQTIFAVDKGGYGDRKAYYQLLHRHLPHGDTELATLAAYRRELQREIKPFPGVSNTLECLTQHYVLALLSNGDPEHQREKLRQSGLGGLFLPVRILITGDIDSRKPDPAVYHTIQRMLGVPMRSILHVGDQWEADVLGPSALGMQTCWVSGSSERKSEYLPNHTAVAGIPELPGVLEIKPDKQECCHA
jgi:putative hydrolase of the HAD superfamily